MNTTRATPLREPVVAFRPLASSVFYHTHALAGYTPYELTDAFLWPEIDRQLLLLPLLERRRITLFHVAFAQKSARLDIAGGITASFLDRTVTLFAQHFGCDFPMLAYVVFSKLTQAAKIESGRVDLLAGGTMRCLEKVLECSAVSRRAQGAQGFVCCFDVLRPECVLWRSWILQYRSLVSELHFCATPTDANSCRRGAQYGSLFRDMACLRGGCPWTSEHLTRMVRDVCIGAVAYWVGRCYGVHCAGAPGAVRLLGARPPSLFFGVAPFGWRAARAGVFSSAQGVVPFALPLLLLYDELALVSYLLRRALSRPDRGGEEAHAVIRQLLVVTYAARGCWLRAQRHVLPNTRHFAIPVLDNLVVKLLRPGECVDLSSPDQQRRWTVAIHGPDGLRRHGGTNLHPHGDQPSLYDPVAENGLVVLRNLLDDLRCAFCCRRNRRLRLCAGCSSARYCSRHCQKGGWSSGHRALCRQLALE